VPTLLRAGLYPSALLYAVYGAFVIWGFVVWLRLARNDGPDGVGDPSVQAVGA
jgi:nicotinamide mononucleotide transporter